MDPSNILFGNVFDDIFILSRYILNRCTCKCWNECDCVSTPQRECTYHWLLYIYIKSVLHNIKYDIVRYCLTYLLHLHYQNMSISHADYFEMTTSYIFYLPFIIIYPEPVCSIYRLFWHNQILSVLHTVYCDITRSCLFYRLYIEYFQFLNRLYDITWLGAVYA